MRHTALRLLVIDIDGDVIVLLDYVAIGVGSEREAQKAPSRGRDKDRTAGRTASDEGDLMECFLKYTLKFFLL